MPARHIADLAGTRRNQFRIRPAGVVGPPTSEPHLIGELHMDSLGSLWRCTASGTPGTWVNAAEIAGDYIVGLPIATTVLDSVDPSLYGATKWAVEISKSSRLLVLEVVAAHDGATASEMRPVSMQLGTGTFDVAVAVTLVPGSPTGSLEISVTPASTGWSVSWQRIYTLSHIV